MSAKEAVKFYNSILDIPLSPNFLASLSLDPRKIISSGTRPLSISVEDGAFGDSGKGAKVAKWNRLLLKYAKLGYIVSIGANGGSNAGHQAKIDGEEVTSSLLPMGTFQENCVAVISRGKLIHDQDLRTEIETKERLFGGCLPGQLKIDSNALLGLDTHRAYEAALKSVDGGGNGSTNTGNGPGYASLLERNALTIGDLISEDWEGRFRKHYQLYQYKTRGFPGFEELDKVKVKTLSENKGETRCVGTEDEFIDRLAENRRFFIQKGYIDCDTDAFYREIWNNPNIPVTIELAQGIGIDSWIGVYPDTTGSRPSSRHINDATYNIIEPTEIALRMAIMKPWISSVGSRRLPTIKNEEREEQIRINNKQYGKVSGRPYDIYPANLALYEAYQRAAGFNCIGLTFVDALKPYEIMDVITHFVEKQSKEERPYRPYQRELDKLDAVSIPFPTWDGSAATIAKSFNDLPAEAQVYISLLSKIAPVVMASKGPDVYEYVMLENLLEATA